MNRFLFLSAVLVFVFYTAKAQTNIISTNPAAEQVMLGNYNPLAYQASLVKMHPDTISRGILKRVSPDSLHAYLSKMATFETRNSGSDTNSLVRGIGAARKWAFKKFQQFSSVNGGRLLPSYLQFDMPICGTNRHKNIFAVLPGTDTTDKSIIIVEGHFDSRCAVLCDTACLAQGMEDNGSGSALVLELARVMSRYSYRHSIVFLLLTSEEQSLNGSETFSSYCQQKGIKIRAVLNNDVIGGVICGKTSSPPSCPGVGNIDSTHVRLFSFGGFSSFHKGLARFTKLEYQELIRPYATVPMTLHVMTPEDRTGRGGDHIPFRSRGYTSIRLTSANENGDANVAALTYTDRQHTSSDILGVDTNNDQVLDSFFVDFNYLARNAVINGNAVGMAAIGPKTPDFNISTNGGDIFLDITQQTQYQKYRLGLRTTTFDWDTVYVLNGASSFTLLAVPNNTYIASVASVDDKDVESLFSKEVLIGITESGLDEKNASPFQLLQNKPNPSDEATSISVVINKEISFKSAYILITDLVGKEIKKLPITLKQGVNEVDYSHGYHASGTYFYTLVIDGKKVETKKMVFTN